MNIRQRKRERELYVSIRDYVSLFGRIFRKAVQLCFYNDRNSENHGNTRSIERIIFQREHYSG